MTARGVAIALCVAIVVLLAAGTELLRDLPEDTGDRACTITATYGADRRLHAAADPGLGVTAGEDAGRAAYRTHCTVRVAAP